MNGTGVDRRSFTAVRRVGGGRWARRGTIVAVVAVAGAGARWVRSSPSRGVRVTPGTLPVADGLADHELLDLAVAGYGGSSPPGWRDLTDDELGAMSLVAADLHGPSGMDARITTDDAGHHVIAYAGTAGWLVGRALTPDALAGLRGLVVPADQTRDAVELATRVKDGVGPDQLTLCGHSLGGRNAAAASVVTGARAVTFNAAGVSDADLMYALRRRRRRAGLRVHLGSWLTDPFATQRRTLWRDQIRNYVAGSDLVTYGQDGLGLRDALGTRVRVPGSRNPFQAHRLDQFAGKIP